MSQPPLPSTPPSQTDATRSALAMLLFFAAIGVHVSVLITAWDVLVPLGLPDLPAAYIVAAWMILRSLTSRYRRGKLTTEEQIEFYAGSLGKWVIVLLLIKLGAC